MKRTLLAAFSGFAIAIAAAPAVAQDNEPSAEEMDQVMTALAESFPVEPLTVEQEARLPQATRIVEKMIPEGAMAEMMGTMFDDMLGPIMETTGGPAISTVVAGTGLTAPELDLTDQQTAKLATLFDPAWEERRAREMDVFPQMMADMMTVMEPPMRKAMSELYAINFTQTELDEIEAFFSTETGTSFARKSFTMSSDPRVLSATMEVLPEMMGAMAGIEERFAKASADLPAKRSFGELTADEQSFVAKTTGYSVEDLRSLTDGGTVEEAKAPE